MSIPGTTALRPILAEVEADPRPPARFELLGPLALRGGARGEALALASAPRTDYASPIHFWAQGLLALLVEQGVPELYLDQGPHGLCAPLDEAALRAEIGARLAGLATPRPWPFEGRVIEAYRMMDEIDSASWVGAHETDYFAVYWDLRLDAVDASATGHP